MGEPEDRGPQEGAVDLTFTDWEALLAWSGRGYPEEGDEAPAEVCATPEEEEAPPPPSPPAPASDSTGDFESEPPPEPPESTMAFDVTGAFELAQPSGELPDMTGSFDTSKMAPPQVDRTGSFDTSRIDPPAPDRTGDFGTEMAQDPQTGAPKLEKRDPAPVLDSAAHLKDILGTTVGGCRLDKELGNGAMGTVFRATHLSLDKPVAVKILNPSLFFEKKHVDSFFQEARAAASIEHQSILTIHNVGSERGLLFMVMQLVEGESLADKIMREVKVSVAETARMGIEAASGLRVAHEKGIIHRDIKPANLMLTWAGEIKIADFGLAKRTGKGQSDSGDIMGTPSYMPPEQIEGVEVDNRADLYALGVTLYYTATGKKPFEAAMVPQMLQMHLTQEAVPAHVREPSVPESLGLTIARMMRKKPEDRQPDAGVVVDELNAVLREVSPEPEPPRPSGTHQSKRGPSKIRRFRSKLNDVLKPFKWTEEDA